MPGDKDKLTVKATVKIVKYAEGVDPSLGTPFDTIEKEIVLTGDDAIKALRDMGGNVNGTN